MANPPFDWDANSPGDSDIASQFPSNERSLRDVAQSFADIEHDKTTGRHKLPAVADATARDALANLRDGMIVIRKDKKLLEFRDGGVWMSDGIETGSKVIFYQASAPYGFTQDTSINDRVLRDREHEELAWDLLGGGNAHKIISIA